MSSTSSQGISGEGNTTIQGDSNIIQIQKIISGTTAEVGMEGISGIPVHIELGFNAETESLTLRNFRPKKPSDLELLRLAAQEGGTYLILEGVAILSSQSRGHLPVQQNSP